jgi:putative ABC transport system permease protein
MLSDLAQTRRLFRRHPSFVAFAVATLGVSIGAATLVFSLVHGALLRSLPFERPGELVWMYNARTERDRAPLSVLDLEDYRRDNTTLADFAVFTNWAANLTGNGPAERIEGTRVSGNFFDVLGARPLLGRPLEREDELGDARVAILTCSLWQRRFAGDPRIVGQTIALNGASYVVVGVLPAAFMFPFREAEIAVPIALRSDPRRTDRGANFLRVVARLGPGVTLEKAETDLNVIARRLQTLYPEEDSRKTGVSLYPLHNEIVRDYRPMLWTLFGATMLFLVIGCGNLANLLFVRAIDRAPEFVIRASLGASRVRLARLLATEAFAIAILGGVAGTLLAGAGVSLWHQAGPANFPRRDEITIDGGVLAFAIGTSLLVALGCAIAPIRAAARAGAGAAGTRSMTGTRRDRWLRRAFVGVQIGGAALLLVCMTLSAQALSRLQRVDAGFRPEQALTMQLSLPPARYSDPARIDRFYTALRTRIDSMSGVRAAGVVSLRPLSGLLSATDVAFPGRPAPPPDEVPQAHFRIASAGYFSAAGISMIAGREFAGDDLANGRPVAIVSRTFAERHWPGELAVGRTVQIAQPGSPHMEIVGVVGDVKQFGLDGPPTADLYVPLPQMPRSQVPLVAARMYWVVRTEGDPQPYAKPLQEIVASIDSDVASSSIQTLNEIVDASLAGWRANVHLLQVFGQLAIALCAIGVYAVAAFSAGSRRRELGIRATFGATRSELQIMVLREELAPVAIGLGCGLTAAALVAPLLRSSLFGISPFNLWAYALTALGLLLVAALASYMPARQAGAADPVDLLRV